MGIDEIGVKLEDVSNIFVGYGLDPSGFKYILDEMLGPLERLQFQRGLELAKEAREAQEKALADQIAWDRRKKRDKLSREGANDLDNEIDRTLGNLLSGLETFASFPEGSDKRESAREMIDKYFPNGVHPITTKSYIDQHAHVEKVVGELQDNHRSALESLSMEDLVDELESLNQEFGDRLNPEPDEITYDEVRESRKRAEEAFFELFAAVVGEYADDLEKLNEVIRPYLEVNSRIRRHMTRGGRKPGVDPESGEPVDPGQGGTNDGRGAPNDGGSPTDGDDNDGGGTTPDDESTNDGGSSTDGEPQG